MRAHALLLLSLSSLAGCSENAAPDDELTPARAADIARVVSAQDALAGAHLPTIDPLMMSDAEITKVLGAGPFCAFRYTSDGKPVLAWKPDARDSNAAGIVKVNGLLVPLEIKGSAAAMEFFADPIRMTLKSQDAREADRSAARQSRPADLIVEVDEGLRVGYSGYSFCPAEAAA